MTSDTEDSLDEDFFQTTKRERVTRDEILDESFKKAEIITQKKIKSTKTKKKKPFLHSGIYLIIVVLICIGIITYAPWAYVKADQDNNSGQADAFIFKNNEKDNLGYDNESKTIISVFEPQNCSSNDCNYFGLTFDDFKNTPRTTLYGFIFLVILGLIFTIYQIIDRKRNFTIESFTIVHSVFSTVTIIVCAYILIVVLKFFGVYLMLYHNDPLILTNNIVFFSPVVIVLTFVLFGIIKLSFSMLKINYKQLNQIVIEKNNKNPFFIYKGGKSGDKLE